MLLYDLLGCDCVHNICNPFSLLYLTFMIYTLIDFICVDICILLIYVIFYISEFFNNCKSPVNTNSESNLVIHQNKVSSQYSPGRKKTFIFELTPEKTFVEV